MGCDGAALSGGSRAGAEGDRWVKEMLCRLPFAATVGVVVVVVVVGTHEWWGRANSTQELKRVAGEDMLVRARPRVSLERATCGVGAWSCWYHGSTSASGTASSSC